MSALAPDPTSHEVITQSEGDVIRLTCTGKDCGWTTTATEDKYVAPITERHQRLTETYKGK